MLCLLAAMSLAKVNSSWYGPATVTATIKFTGNPYDPAENDIDAVFTGPHGQKLHRLAYYVGHGQFAATLVAPEPGTYTASIERSGEVVAHIPGKLNVTKRLSHGFIGLQGRRFAWTDGTPYFPLGYDYAWRNGNGETVAQGIATLGHNGGNWSRIWASHWDDKNPFWPTKDEAVAPGELRQAPLQTWDAICSAAEAAGVSFQFVLFHHGPYSTTTDSNWKEHPWNTANGGFLADPTDFFVNPEAKRRTKIWLRYAVARYAASPAVMAWELFNEVQWVDAIKKHPERTPDVAAWHREMIAYVKSLDPYHHLVTTSSSESLNGHVFDAVDYMQPHTYPSNVLAAIGGYRFTGKPGFFGEFGPPSSGGPNYRREVRDGIYGAILAGHAGAGEFWFWDRIDRSGLAADYSAARKVIDESGLLEHAAAQPADVWVETPASGALTLAPGAGWEKSATTQFDLPAVSLAALRSWSPYFQSLDGGNKAWASPLLLKFEARTRGTLQLSIGQVSSTGGALTVWVNDRQVIDQRFDPPTSGGGDRRRALAVDYPAGAVSVRIENHGSDWVRLDSITVPEQGATAQAQALADPSWALVRIVGSDTSAVTVHGLPLADGAYHVTVIDAATGTKSQTQARVSGGSVAFKHLPPDSIVSLRR